MRRDSGAAKAEAEPETEMFRSALSKYCFIRCTPFKDLKDEYKLEIASVLTGNMNLVLADLLDTRRKARDQSGFAHDVFSKRNMANGVRVVTSVMAPGAPGHVF